MNPAEPLAATQTLRPHGPVVEIIDPMVAEIMRNKTPAQRLAIAFCMWDNVREMVRANVRQRHPDWSEQEVQHETAQRMRGRND